MKLKTFSHFFLFCIVCTFLLGIISILYGLIFHLTIHSLYILLFVSMSIAYSVSMGIWGLCFAYTETINITKSNFSIEDITSKLDSLKYKNPLVENSIFVYSSSKYYEWFYGKVYVKENEDTLSITGSKNILNKIMNFRN
jgi:hypothetical protein